MKKLQPRSRKQKTLTKQFTFWWQTSKVGNVVVKAKRASKAKKRHVKQGQTIENSPQKSVVNPWRSLWNKLPRIELPRIDKRLFAVIIFLTLLLAIIGRPLSLRLNSGLFGAMSAQEPITSGIDVLLAIYEETTDYAYVDMLGLLSINYQNDVPVAYIAIDPDIAMSESGHKFRSLLALGEARGVSGVDLLSQAVESLLAVSVDRYILISKQVLIQFLQVENLPYVAGVNLVDPEAGTFSVEQVLTGEQIAQYLAADAAGTQNRLGRQGDYVAYWLEKFSGLGGAVWAYTHQEMLANMLYTNFSKMELLNIGFSSLGGFGGIRNVAVGVNQSIFVDSRQGGYFSPVISTVDEVVSSVMRRDRVVKEQARIEVFNATNQPGLASAMRRRLQNLGANVIRAGNSPELSERNKLYVSNVGNFPFNTSLILEELDQNAIIIEEPYPLNHTGDLVLVLGAEI